jgi:hypothetical protein
METLFSKKFEKPLDKPHIVWYNVNVSEREKSPPPTSLVLLKGFRIW